MREVDCIFEIQTGSNQKMEIDYKYNRLRLDRVLNVSMGYPGNYGYIPDTLCEDGDAIDVIMPVDYTVPMGCVIKCKIIGVFIMEDDKGKDEKLIVMPADDVDARFVDVNDYSDLPKITVDRIEHFFQHYKDLTHKKVITNGFADRNVAVEYLEKSYQRYNSHSS